MELIIKKLTEEYAKQLCEWKYNAEYSVYNFAPWDIAVQQKWSIADPKARESDFRSVTNKQGEFVGFFRMTKDKDEKIEIGLGMRPEYCGLGIGKDFVKIITQYVRAYYPNCLIYMEVRTFNIRAVKCYENCGYTVILKHHMDFPWGSDDYYHMEYKNE
ncbi:MAG TPA: GNAT family N-acetyltransferase [Clostridia bacterium]|nr:GNAT family N-acetyltransferase [Clostridia bacterium]